MIMIVLTNIPIKCGIVDSNVNRLFIVQLGNRHLGLTGHALNS